MSERVDLPRGHRQIGLAECGVDFTQPVGHLVDGGRVVASCLVILRPSAADPL